MKPLTAILEGIGSTLQLLVRAVSYTPTLWRQRARFIEQCYLIGYTTLPIVAILSFFIGGVLALQAGYSMSNFGAKQFIGSLVGLSMARELGPVMAAILLAGRVGSAIAAELASMKVYQEIDALETMNIPPAKVLVLGAGTNADGPGPLVSLLVGKMAGQMRVPVTVVPGNLSDEQLDQLT